MIEIHSISPTYPINKSKKVIRERKQDEYQSSDDNEEDDDRDPKNLPVQHIDEII